MTETGDRLDNTEADALGELCGLDDRYLGQLEPGKGREEVKECRWEYRNHR